MHGLKPPYSTANSAKDIAPHNAQIGAPHIQADIPPEMMIMRTEHRTARKEKQR
jgi:hypothetical protein